MCSKHKRRQGLQSTWRVNRRHELFKEAEGSINRPLNPHTILNNDLSVYTLLFK